MMNPNSTPNFNPNPNQMLFEHDTFTFACHPGISCFTRCCKNPDMYLYPYDIIRMKHRLGIPSDIFLEQYTLSAFRDNPYFPSVMLKMADNSEKSCPFLSASGCTMYEDRPFSCRAYPLERAVARAGEGSRTDCYFVARHDHCLGHGENRTWRVSEWIENQKIGPYNRMNDLWVDIDTLLRANPWGDKGIESPALKMAFMACFNGDRFRDFVFESSFLFRFDISAERIAQIRGPNPDPAIESDVELMKLGFDWVRFMLTSKGPLMPKV